MQIIYQSNLPLNVYRIQIFVEQQSHSFKIINKKVFNNNRKLVTAETFDENDMISLIKNYFHPTKVNAIFIKDNCVHDLFRETVYKYFKNSNLKIALCNKVLDDIENEDDLLEYIKNEHHKNNHRGINENFQQLKSKIYHPKLKLRIQQFINNCYICNIEKYDRKPIAQMFRITETPDKPREVIHVDVFYSLQKTLFLTFIDKFSKFAQAIKIENRSWVEIKRALTHYLSIVGDIKKIVTNNELGFKALPLTEFLKERNIEIHFISNNNHSSNADVERLHNTMNEHIRFHRHDPERDTDTVEAKIYKVIMFYNNSIHSTIGYKPIDFNNGNVTAEDYPRIKGQIIRLKERIISKLNRNRENCEVQIGEVYLKNERGGKNHAKFRKVKVDQLDNDHVITQTKHKYYKSHIKRKKKDL